MKKMVLALAVLTSFAATPVLADDDDPPPYGCTYVLGKLICVDEPMS